MKKFKLSLIVLIIITVSSCSEMNKEFKFMNEIRNEISEKYETDQVEVNLQNKNKLLVTITDPKFDDYSSERKETISKNIGTLVKSIGKDRKPIISGVVKFVNQKSYGVAKTSKSDIYNMYKEVDQ